LSGGLKRRLN